MKNNFNKEIKSNLLSIKSIKDIEELNHKIDAMEKELRGNKSDLFSNDIKEFGKHNYCGANINNNIYNSNKMNFSNDRKSLRDARDNKRSYSSNPNYISTNNSLLQSKNNYSNKCISNNNMSNINYSYDVESRNNTNFNFSHETYSLILKKIFDILEIDDYNNIGSLLSKLCSIMDKEKRNINFQNSKDNNDDDYHSNLHNKKLIHSIKKLISSLYNEDYENIDIKFIWKWIKNLTMTAPKIIELKEENLKLTLSNIELKDKLNQYQNILSDVSIELNVRNISELVNDLRSKLNELALLKNVNSNKNVVNSNDENETNSNDKYMNTYDNAILNSGKTRNKDNLEKENIKIDEYNNFDEKTNEGGLNRIVEDNLNDKYEFSSEQNMKANINTPSKYIEKSKCKDNLNLNSNECELIENNDNPTEKIDEYSCGNMTSKDLNSNNYKNKDNHKESQRVEIDKVDLTFAESENNITNVSQTENQDHIQNHFQN